MWVQQDKGAVGQGDVLALAPKASSSRNNFSSGTVLGYFRTGLYVYNKVYVLYVL